MTDCINCFTGTLIRDFNIATYMICLFLNGSIIRNCMEYAYGKSAFLQALMITHIHTKENNLYIFRETEIIRINLVLSNQIEGFLRKNLIDVLDPC